MDHELRARPVLFHPVCFYRIAPAPAQIQVPRIDCGSHTAVELGVERHLNSLRRRRTGDGSFRDGIMAEIGGKK